MMTDIEYINQTYWGGRGHIRMAAKEPAGPMCTVEGLESQLAQDPTTAYLWFMKPFPADSTSRFVVGRHTIGKFDDNTS